MLVFAGQPSLHDNYEYMLFWFKGALQRHCKQNICKTSLSLVKVIRFCQTSVFGFLGTIFWLGRAQHLGPSSRQLASDTFNVQGWLILGIWLWRPSDAEGGKGERVFWMDVNLQKEGNC